MFEQLEKNQEEYSKEVSKALAGISEAACDIIKENEELTKKLKSLKELKLYEFHCKGYFVGSTTIVRADRIQNARECIKAVLDNAGIGDQFDPDEVFEVKGTSGVCGTVVYFDNGDY